MKRLVPTGSVKINVPAGLCRMTASADGQDYEIELPLERFLQLAAKAQQESRAYYIRLSASNERLPILSVPAIMPATIEIATMWTTEQPKIVVTLDRATPGELALALSSDESRVLGEQLILRTDELES